MDSGIRSWLLALSILVAGGVSACIHYSTAATTKAARQTEAEANKRIKELEEHLKKSLQMRQAERQKRITTQQQSRQDRTRKIESTGFTYRPIVHIESPFPDRRGTPRQVCSAQALFVLLCRCCGAIRCDTVLYSALRCYCEALCWCSVLPLRMLNAAHARGKYA
jgi:Flp pilus assembly protein TadB